MLANGARGVDAGKDRGLAGCTLRQARHPQRGIGGDERGDGRLEMSIAVRWHHPIEQLTQGGHGHGEEGIERGIRRA